MKSFFMSNFFGVMFVVFIISFGVYVTYTGQVNRDYIISNCQETDLVVFAGTYKGKKVYKCPKGE